MAITLPRGSLRARRDVYGAENEEILGEALAPFRGQAVISTKFGFDHLQGRVGR